jgi:predicted transcriptional regulator
MGLAINTASNRLKRLYDRRLVRREYEVSAKGLQYYYYFWQWI